MIDLTLVVTVDNNADYLRFVLIAIARQRFRDVEVVIADDGSGPEIAEAIKDFGPTFPFPIRHIWHEDRGWRKNVVMNAAFREVKGAWVVFIEGDCLPQHRFPEDHAMQREEGVFLCGRRVESSERWTRGIDESAVMSGRIEHIGLSARADAVMGRALRMEGGMRFENVLPRRVLHSRVRGMLGSSVSAVREHAIAIYGFDEEYDGQDCGEDSDVQFRPELLGLRGTCIRHLAIQYHLFDPRTVVRVRSMLRFERVKRERRVRCAMGQSVDEFRENMVRS